jgi:glycosyltransferase involved in cell wall biosynthesis
MQKSLSIVIPAYNEERYLPACLESVAAQTVKADEVIVVDNGSSDRTAEIAQSFKFVKLIREHKQGIGYARSRGFDEARSDIIARIDSDTVLPPDWVEKIQSFYANPAHHNQAVTGGCSFYNLHSGWLTGVTYGLIVFHFNRLLLGHYFPWGSNSALPKSAWEKVRTKVSNRPDIHEDLDLGFKLAYAGYGITYVHGLRVGAVARRIVTDRGDLWIWLKMWPRTYYINGRHRQIFIWPLALAVWVGRYGIFAAEKIADVMS